MCFVGGNLGYNEVIYGNGWALTKQELLKCKAISTYPLANYIDLAVVLCSLIRYLFVRFVQHLPGHLSGLLASIQNDLELLDLLAQSKVLPNIGNIPLGRFLANLPAWFLAPTKFLFQTFPELLQLSRYRIYL